MVPPRSPGCEFSTRGLMPTRSRGLRWCFVLELQPFSFSCNRMLPVQLDPENGEAWNNVACLHMINKKSKAAFISFKEALKFRRSNWQLWENYSHVAVDIGNFHQIIKNGGGGEEIWGLYARWHKMVGNLAMCSEALLKQVRAYQGSDLWHNLARFKKFAQASLRLCDVYMEIASSNGDHRELFAAEMHLRNSVKQAVSFSDTKEFADLQAYLVEIRKRLDTPNNVS